MKRRLAQLGCALVVCMAVAGGWAESSIVAAGSTGEEQGVLAGYTSQEWLQLGQSHYSQKNFEKAIEAYGHSIKLNPLDVAAYIGRGKAYFQIANYQLAIGDFAVASRLEPKTSSIYYSLGQARFLNEDYVQSISDLSNAITLNPNYVESYILRGRVYEAEGEVELALNDYNKAIELQTKNSKAYFYRGHYYLTENKYDLAIADFNKAIFDLRESIDSDLRELWHFYCLSYSDIASYSKLIDAGLTLQGYQGYYEKRGTHYLMMTHFTTMESPKYFKESMPTVKAYYELALQDFTKLITFNPKDGKSYLLRVMLYCELKEYNLALADCDAIIQLEPKLGYFVRADIYYEMKNYQAAIEDYNKLILVYPGNYVYYQRRGRVYSQLKKYHLAIADYRKSVRLGNNEGYINFDQALVLDALGEKEQALNYYQKFIEYMYPATTKDIEYANERLNILRSTGI